jgi:RNA polymerase sigma-70 factor (ECF subfamily)
MEDREIIQLYWERNEQAIRESEHKYGLYCRSIACSILPSPQDAEETVSDTWLRAWNAMPPQKPGRLSAFLGRITRNLAFDRWRRQNAEKRGGGELSLVLEELAECVSGGGNAEDALEMRELGRALNGFIAALPRDKRVLFLGRYWYALPVNELAKRCGMTEGAAAAALRRLRIKLRKQLEEGGFEL